MIRLDPPPASWRFASSALLADRWALAHDRVRRHAGPERAQPERAGPGRAAGRRRDARGTSTASTTGTPPKTDAEGRITLPALIPGALYRITDFSTAKDDAKGPQVRKDFTVKPGETLDLGDILIEKPAAG